MSDFITLACPSCGGSLRVTTDAGRFACKYCSREHIVRNQNGIITVTPVLEKLDRIASGVSRHASELAIPRLQSEIAALAGKMGDARRALEKWDRQREEGCHKIIAATALLLIPGALAIIIAGSYHWFVGLVVVLCVIAAIALFVAFLKHRREAVNRLASQKIEAAADQIAGLRKTIESKSSELEWHRDNVRI